jgi:hypothetical protein
MRKLLRVLCVLVALTTAASTAIADVISLGGSSNFMTFTGTGSSNWTLSLPVSGLTGSAFGTGSLTSGPAAYTITQGLVTIMGTYEGSGLWDIAQSGGGLLGFTYGSYLTGELSLLTLELSGSTGYFNQALVANLAITGGSLAPTVGSDAALGITIDFPSSTALTDLPRGQTLQMGVSSGQLEAATVPEPGPMVLIGSGLVLLGGLVQRPRTAK